MRARLHTGLDVGLCSDRVQREAAEDWLLRQFRSQHRGQGSGRSGQILAYRPGPEICPRSAVVLQDDGLVEVRFEVGLPGRGRRILGRQATDLILDDLPRALNGLFVDETSDLLRHIRSVVTQRGLRDQLESRGLVAFIANGAVLPRASGVDRGPLSGAVPFRSPPTLEVSLDGPDGPISGMGIGKGVTVIVGGGFHGKSTVLQAIQSGHLDHMPGDGRERVVAAAHTVKIRAEDGRRVHRVDISPFLRELPGGRTTRPFSTEDASGSTSQAAAIVEAVEAGARVLLLDEDTCATNLLARDARMRALIPPDREPITPLVERIRQLHERWHVSTIMVIGGVGDYLAVADRVVHLDNWRPHDLTAAARAMQLPVPEPPDALTAWQDRAPSPSGLEPGKLRARDTRAIRYGDGEIDLTAVEQVLDSAHAYTIGHALRFIAEELADGSRTMRQLLDALEAILDDEGVEALSPRTYPDGRLVRPRRHEVAAALNRLRTLQCAV